MDRFLNFLFDMGSTNHFEIFIILHSFPLPPFLFPCLRVFCAQQPRRHLGPAPASSFAQPGEELALPGPFLEEKRQWLVKWGFPKSWGYPTMVALWFWIKRINDVIYGHEASGLVESSSVFASSVFAI